MFRIHTPLTLKSFQNVLNVFAVQLNNTAYSNKVILHSQPRNTGINIFGGYEYILLFSEMRCFEDDCYRHDS